MKTTIVGPAPPDSSRGVRGSDYTETEACRRRPASAPGDGREWCSLHDPAHPDPILGLDDRLAPERRQAILARVSLMTHP